MSSSKDYLGSYRLIRLIRGGQVSNVWDAIRDGDSERVAIKVLLAAFKHKKDEIEQLRNEAKVGSLFEHPNVIRIFEFNERYDLPFLVMQLFNAKNLKQELRDNPLILALNLPLVVDQCVSALRYLNESGWVHCDVKPDNFLVDEQGTVKLIDFSIAKPMGQRRGFMSRNKAIQGTRSYMAPEQIRGRVLDGRADIYGFGCVAFELLAGRPPFTGVNPDDLLQKHLRAAPPGLSAANKNVSDEFATLVAKMLHKDPDKRPQSFSEVQQELKSLRLFRAGRDPVIGNNKPG